MAVRVILTRRALGAIALLPVAARGQPSGSTVFIPDAAAPSTVPGRSPNRERNPHAWGIDDAQRTLFQAAANANPTLLRVVVRLNNLRARQFKEDLVELLVSIPGWEVEDQGVYTAGTLPPFDGIVIQNRSAVEPTHEIVEPSIVWWQADHVEALVRSGRPHEAAQALARFESSAALSPLVWASATTSRCRALMATNPDDAEHWFAVSLGHHDRLAAPFELARTLLCRAERRVATSSPLDPSADLAEALAIFEGLGASSWSAQAQALRDAAQSRAEPNLEELLSPAERRVAEAVVAGLTNREVAATLYVSEKTVEFHLHNIYRKYRIRSRTQLVRRLSRPD